MNEQITDVAPEHPPVQPEITDEEAAKKALEAAQGFFAEVPADHPVTA